MPLTKKIQLPSLLLSLLALAIVGYKSAITSYTHDESFSYSRYVHQTFMEIISYETPYTNNHILNTVMMKWEETLLGSNGLVMRLHSLLALLLYLLMAVQLLRRFPRSVALPLFVLLIANPYLLDFFGLARGYAMSIGFMIMSCCSMFRSMEEDRYGPVIWMNVGAMLAAFSNFALINYYVALLITWNCWMLLCRRGPHAGRISVLKKNGINLLFVVLTTGVLWEPIRKISKMGMLDFGGKAGIVEDTITSLLTNSLYHTVVAPEVLLRCAWVVAGFVLLIFAWCLIGLLRKGRAFVEKHKELCAVNLILLLIIAATISQHLLLKNDYFIGRFALFLVPLFMLNLLFFLKIFLDRKRTFPVTAGLTAVLALLMLINTVQNWNWHSYLDWEYDRETRHVMALLKDHRERHFPPDRRVNIGNSWWYEPSVNFYRLIWKLDWLNEADRNGFAPDDDYCYIISMEVKDSARIDTAAVQLLYMPKERDSYFFFNRHTKVDSVQLGLIRPKE